jgi:hypothetical protein
MDQARSILEARPGPLPPGFERLVVVLSDATSLAGLAGDPFAPAEALRTLDPPARISCFRFSDNPFGTDPDCSLARDQEVLVAVANAFDSPTFNINQPRGEFACRTICPCDQPCPASPCNPGVPPNCQYAQGDIDAFVDLVRRSICSFGPASQLSITQQTVQSPSPATILDSVTLSVQATSSGFGPYFQWRLDGTPIVGASGNTLAVDRLNLCDTGQFDCLILGGPCDELTSNALVLNVDAGGDDCNTNGIPDTCELALGYDWTGTIGGGDHDTTGGTEGGSGSDLDFAFGNSVAVDANGNVIYTGSVRSNSSDIDLDPTDTVLNYNSGEQQNEDWFVTKLAPGVAGAPAFSWNVLAASEFPGDPSFGASERGYCIDADPGTGAIVVAATMRDAVDAEFDFFCSGGGGIYAFEDTTSASSISLLIVNSDFTDNLAVGDGTGAVRQ